ncbi:hypothetical protein ASE77_18870 [Sphingomonas sp. Leaf226]|jgi:hypothetical protein|nr:hypothetical protein ASE77_18870 [Sphingomonas sp. Leaf226]
MCRYAGSEASFDRSLTDENHSDPPERSAGRRLTLFYHLKDIIMNRKQDLLPAATTVAVPVPFTSKALQKSTIAALTHKGGVSKTTINRATTEVTRSHLSAPGGYRVVAMDGDGDNGQYQSFLGTRDANGKLAPDQDPAIGVGSFDARSNRERGVLLDMAERDEELLVFDLPGGALSDMVELNETLTARDLVDVHRECGRRFVALLPITPLLASISSVLTAIELFGPDADYLVVKNMAAGKEEDFVLWQEGIVNRHGRHIGGKARAALETVNGRVLELPALNAGIYARIDALGLSFTEALSSPLLPLSQRLSCRRWLHAWTGQLDTIADWLALPAGYRWTI